MMLSQFYLYIRFQQAYQYPIAYFLMNQLSFEHPLLLSVRIIDGVTNEGELAGFASEIIDYIPNGLKFTSEMNTNWYQGTDGNLLNRELANTIINPGETKSIKLTLSKAMTASNTGTFMNSAEINKASNKNSTNDIDSTPGNKELKEDDYSTAELIISIGTGSVVVNVLIIATVIVVIGAGTFLIKKKVLNREND